MWGIISQAQHDCLMGQYPVDADDAVQMCAIQMQAQSGPHLLEDSSELDKSLDKYLIPQVVSAGPSASLAGQLDQHPASCSHQNDLSQIMQVYFNE